MSKINKKSRVVAVYIAWYPTHKSGVREGGKLKEGNNPAASSQLAPPCFQVALSSSRIHGNLGPKAAFSASKDRVSPVPSAPAVGAEQHRQPQLSAVDTMFWFSGRTLEAQTRTQQ